MTSNSYKCNCCKTEMTKQASDVNSYSHYICKNCGYEHFISNENTVNENTYEDDTDYDDDLTIATHYSDLLQWNHFTAEKYIKNNLKNKKLKILDVGCFNGFFVKELISKGHDAYGIDFNEKAINYGHEKYGLDGKIYLSNIKSLPRQEKKFDIVTIFEVIEHLESIDDLISDACSILNDDGIIIISTPNKNMCWRPSLDSPPHHLSRFSPKSLQLYLSRFGLEILQTKEQMSSLDLFRNYIGSRLRKSDNSSLRGGEFQHKESSIMLRRTLNKTKTPLNLLLYPINKLLYLLGLRYISQIVVVKKT